VDRVDSMYAG
jgi:hypothetical protein